MENLLSPAPALALSYFGGQPNLLLLYLLVEDGMLLMDMINLCLGIYQPKVIFGSSSFAPVVNYPCLNCGVLVFGVRDRQLSVRR